MERRNFLIVCLLCAGVLATPATAGASDGFFGVVSQTEIDSGDLQQMKAGGIESVRSPVTWGTLEPQRGVYDWDHLDELVGEAAENGVTLLPFIYGTPTWVGPDPMILPTDGHGLDDWNSMLAAIVGRYGTDGVFWSDHPSIPRQPVTTWQIWNEPNTIWFARPGQAVQYAQLVISSAKTIRAADPSARVMLAGLTTSTPAAIGPRGDEYLQRLYGVPGFGNAFDSLALNPYNVSLRGTMDDITWIRQVMNAWGDSKKGIFVTEIGWASDSLTGLGMKSQSGQARILKQAYSAFAGERKALNISGVYWFAWKDQPKEARSCSFCFGTGLLDAAGTPKLAWTALKKVIAADGSASAGVRCVVPRLKGRKIEVARRMLRKNRCRIRVVNRKRRSGEKLRVGTVVGQSPGPRKTRARGTRIRLTVLR